MVVSQLSVSSLFVRASGFIFPYRETFTEKLKLKWFVFPV